MTKGIKLVRFQDCKYISAYSYGITIEYKIGKWTDRKCYNKKYHNMNTSNGPLTLFKTLKHFDKWYSTVFNCDYHKLFTCYYEESKDNSVYSRLTSKHIELNINGLVYADRIMLLNEIKI